MDDRSRWFDVGHSVATDAREAGIEATAAALAGRRARLVMVFAPVSANMAALAEAVRSQLPEDTMVVGCSTTRGITTETDTGGVVVAALGGDGFQVRTTLARDSSTGCREAGVAAAGALAGIDRPYRALVLFNDGLSQSQDEIVRGAYSVVGATVPLVGGCAGDDFDYARTYQMFGSGAAVEVLSDAVIGVAIGSDAPMGVGIAHGWRRQGDPVNVTSSSGGRIYEFDDERAADVFRLRTGIDPTGADVAGFRRQSYRNPIGLARRSGEDLRVVSAIRPDEGSVESLADVPQGAQAWFMATDEKSMVEAAADSCGQAVAALGGTPACGMIVFDCAVRYSMLGADGVRREIGEMARAADAPIAGFYTYGEIARTRGARGMHHLTCVSLAFA